MLSVAIIISRTKLRYPFQWMETYFHELSHGLAALLTFGRIHRIQLEFNGAGCCTTIGGMRIPILLAGYAGAVTWGAVIYLAGWKLNNTDDVTLLNILTATISFSTILWVRNFKTLFIMLVMGCIFYIPTLVPDTQIPGYALEFYGIYVVQSAITAPLELIDGKHVGDGAELANKTLILPEGVWILLWFTYAIATTIWLWQITTPENERFLNPQYIYFWA